MSWRKKHFPRCPPSRFIPQNPDQNCSVLFCGGESHATERSDDTPGIPQSVDTEACPVQTVQKAIAHKSDLSSTFLDLNPASSKSPAMFPVEMRQTVEPTSKMQTISRCEKLALYLRICRPFNAMPFRLMASRAFSSSFSSDTEELSVTSSKSTGAPAYLHQDKIFCLFEPKGSHKISRSVQSQKQHLVKLMSIELPLFLPALVRPSVCFKLGRTRFEAICSRIVCGCTPAQKLKIAVCHRRLVKQECWSHCT